MDIITTIEEDPTEYVGYSSIPLGTNKSAVFLDLDYAGKYRDSELIFDLHRTVKDWILLYSSRTQNKKHLIIPQAMDMRDARAKAIALATLLSNAVSYKHLAHTLDPYNEGKPLEFILRSSPKNGEAIEHIAYRQSGLWWRELTQFIEDLTAHKFGIIDGWLRSYGPVKTLKYHRTPFYKIREPVE